MWEGRGGEVVDAPVGVPCWHWKVLVVFACGVCSCSMLRAFNMLTHATTGEEGDGTWGLWHKRVIKARTKHVQHEYDQVSGVGKLCTAGPCTACGMRSLYFFWIINYKASAAYH